MASVIPGGSYWSKSVALASTAKTTIYTCGDQGEIAFDVTGLSAVASDGVAGTLTFHILQASDAAEYILVYRGPVEADYPLQIEGLPIHLSAGGAIKATATTGDTHTVHVHISGLKTTRSPDARR